MPNSVDIETSCWRNVYWFARMLINSDKYGSVGKKNDLLNNLVNRLEVIVSQDKLSHDEIFKTSKDLIVNTIKTAYKQGSKISSQAACFAEDLEIKLRNYEDIIVFIVTVKYIVLPTNDAITYIPNDDVKFSHQNAAQILNTLGETAVDKVILSWDNLGVKGCLTVERSVVVREFTKLRSNLKIITANHNEIDDNIILTAFVQEFERRLGQKRKGRAGTSLEDAVTFLFDFYNLKSHSKPNHFQTDLEVDKWFTCQDGWYIGISCKRTLRERWKQVSAADYHTLSQYKIKEIWHLITYDKDLSDDKITMLGRQRQIFYLSEDSDIYKKAVKHTGMSKYVRSLSNLISDIRTEQNKS